MSRRYQDFVLLLAALCLAAGVAPASRAEEKPAAAAEELVRVALEAELLGDNDTRQAKLSEAQTLAPDLAAPQWHQARVLVAGKWLPLADAAAASKADVREEEYRTRRDGLEGSVRRELELARWCGREQMADRAELHYGRLLMNPVADQDVKREALKKLELQDFGGQYVSKDSLRQENERAKALVKAANTWFPKLETWDRQLQSDKVAQRERAEKEMSEVRDPMIVPFLEACMQTPHPRLALGMVAILARIPDHEATETLTRMAIVSPHEAVQQATVQELKRRPIHEYAPLLLLALNPYSRSQFFIGVDALGRTHYQHVVAQQGARVNAVATTRVDVGVQANIVTVSRVYASGDPKRIRAFEDARAKAEGNGVKAVLAERDALIRQAWETERRLAFTNAIAAMHNDPFFNVLELTTGQRLAREPSEWWNWWHSYNEVNYTKPLWCNYNRQERIVQFTMYRAKSCFLAGTPVWTETGLRPIETIRPGDRVLSQNPDTGELAFKLVANVTLREPAPVLKIVAAGEAITATRGHPFWVNRIGWRMAKELTTGERVHTLNGGLVLDGIEPQPQPQPAHNLVVADFSTYFVGNGGLLVHDNVYRQPTLALVPGLTK